MIFFDVSKINTFTSYRNFKYLQTLGAGADFAELESAAAFLLGAFLVEVVSLEILLLLIFTLN